MAAWESWENDRAERDLVAARAQRIGWHLREVEIAREIRAARNERRREPSGAFRWLARVAQAAAAFLL